MPRISQLLVREARIEHAGQHHTRVLQSTHVSFRILLVLRVALQSHSQQPWRMSQRASADNGDDLCPRQGGSNANRSWRGASAVSGRFGSRLRTLQLTH